MTEHLPECNYKKNPERNACICERLRACEKRVFAIHPEWIMTGLCKPDCAACRRLTELITEWEYGYKQGLDAAREAVAALVPSEFWEGLEGRPPQWWIVKAEALAAIDELRKP